MPSLLIVVVTGCITDITSVVGIVVVLCDGVWYCECCYQ